MKISVTENHRFYFTRETAINKIVECEPNFFKGNNTATADPEKGGNYQEMKN